MPLEYSKSIQKKLKSSNQMGRDRNKKITYPYLEPNQSIKLKCEKGLKSTNTLNQDYRLQKNFSIFGAKDPRSQTLTNSFPSILSKIYIRVSFAKSFYELYPQTTHATQKEYLSLNKNPRHTKEGEKKIPKNPNLCTVKKVINRLCFKETENTSLPKSVSPLKLVQS